MLPGPWLVAAIVTVMPAAARGATNLAELLARVAANARFVPAVRAEVRFDTPRPDGVRTSTLTLYGHGRIARVEMPDGMRALAKPGKCIVAATPGATPRMVRERVIGGSAFLL